MKKILGSSLILLSSSLFAGAITTVEHGNTANGYQLVFKNVGVRPTSFNTDSSIVLDFPNTTSALKTRGVDITSNGIYNVDVIQGQGRTRAVINLSAAKVYDVRLQGKDVIVTVAGDRKKLANAAATNSPIAQINRPNATVKASKTTYTGLNPIFRRSANDRGAFTIKLPSANTLVDVRNEGSQVILGLSGVNISRKEQKRLDVQDYGTPVSFVDITKSPSGARIALNMGKNGYEYVSYQTRDTYTVEVFKPAPEENSEKKIQELLGFGDGKNYKGEPISLNFQDIEVRAVLQIIAEFTHTNIVVSDGVTGNITLRLDNVPWDQALDIIMKTKGLDKRRSGQIIYVATIEELRNSELTVLKTIQEKAQLTPTRIEKIQVQYASAEELKGTILQMRTTNNVNDQNSKAIDSVLSARGSLTAEPRTNMLIVNDIPEKIAAIRKLVTELDKPVKQVLVDARIVLTKDNFGRDFGVRFGTSFINRNRNNLVTGSGTLNAASDIANSVISGSQPNPDISSRLGVSFPASSGGTSPASYGLAILSGDFLVDLELSALQTEGRVEIVSSPRVVTQDGTKAKVWNGIEIPLVTKDDSGNPSILKDSATLSLDVTPRIAPNHMVNMDLNINNDAIAGTVSVAGQTQFTKTISGVTTSVLVDNGETIVLGGVYQQRQEKSNDKVPVLGEIPVIGNAFKTHRRSFNKDEMLIFVTPRIVDKRLIDQDKFSNLRD